MAPVWLFLAILFLFRWPGRPIVGHLVLLALVGMVLVDLCLYGFQKLPFTCSYLPGKSKVQVVFWGLLLVLVPLIAAHFEKPMLSRLPDSLCMIAVLGAVAAGARWRTNASAKSADALIFEEEYPPEIFVLNLPRPSYIPADQAVIANHSQQTL